MTPASGHLKGKTHGRAFAASEQRWENCSHGSRNIHQQQTFHVQLLWLTDPGATNIEAPRVGVWPRAGPAPAAGAAAGTPRKEDTTIGKSPRATASSSSGSYGRCSAGATCVPADKRLRDPVRLRLLTRRTQGNTKAEVVVAERREPPAVGRRPTIPGSAVPTAATLHAGRARRRPGRIC